MPMTLHVICGRRCNEALLARPCQCRIFAEETQLLSAISLDDMNPFDSLGLWNVLGHPHYSDDTEHCTSCKPLLS